MKSVYELAKKYYPRYWDKRKLDLLLKAGKLTQEEYDAVINGIDLY